MNLRTLNANGGGPLFAELRERRDAALAARTAAAEAQGRQYVAMRERDRLKRALVEAQAEGVASDVKRATKAIADHDRKAEEDAARVEGLALAAKRRESELRSFIAAELDGLLAEHRGAAQGTRHRLADALHALEDAVAEWTEAARTTSELVAAAGRGMELRTATLPHAVTSLSRDASRIDPSAIPSPLPEDSLSGHLYLPPAVPSREDTVPVGRAVFTRV